MSKITKKCEICNKPFTTDREYTICKSCATKPIITKTCKECGHKFGISASEKRFFESKGLVLPNRCPSCRKARKTASEK